MEFNQNISVVLSNGETCVFNNCYVYCKDKIDVANGTFMNKAAISVLIPEQSCNIKVGDIAFYNNQQKLVVCVVDNTKRAKLLPHIKLILQ